MIWLPKCLIHFDFELTVVINIRLKKIKRAFLRKEKIGRKTCLTFGHEASLVKYIQNLEKHVSITSVDVKTIAFSCAVQILPF